MTPARTETFDTPTPPRIRVDIPKGRITVTAAKDGQTRIDMFARNGDALAHEWIEDAVVGQAGEEVMVKVRKSGIQIFGIGGTIDVVVQVPAGAETVLGTGAGRIETIGQMGPVRASTGAGVISIEQATSADLNTGAGDIAIATASGSVDIRTGSGRVRVGKVAADARISTGAGDAEVEEVAGDARIKTAAGSIEVARAGDSLDTFTAAGGIRVHHADHGRVRAKSLAGGISVGVAKGTAALLDVRTINGRVDSDLEPAGEPEENEKRVEVTISTMSGSVHLTRA